MTDTKISGNIVDVVHEEVYPGTLVIRNGIIVEITRARGPFSTFLIPGFIDSHIHIESSMLTPPAFARAAVVHGTVATVSDPHEIANVMGIEGVRYMIDEGKKVPFKFYFSAPSCVPATDVETSGAALDRAAVEALLSMPEILYLGEVMNFPGVIAREATVMGKINAALRQGKRIDGHAPGLTGDALVRYAAAGITTNHECLTPAEVIEDIERGVIVQVRHGSAASIFEECLPLLAHHADRLMFCSDDKHPDDLLKGHIDEMVRKALAQGTDIMKTMRIASVNPVRHYGLDVGLLQKGDSADLLEIDNLRDVGVLKTFIGGRLVAKRGTSLIPQYRPPLVNNFHAIPIKPSDFTVSFPAGKFPCIVALDGQIFTERCDTAPAFSGSYAITDTARDILKLTVVNRYRTSTPSMAFIKGFGLKEGALASSVAHDSHNIIAVGATDEELCRAVNCVIESKGGIAAVCGERELLLPLPVAGLMSDEDCTAAAQKYTELTDVAHGIGSHLRSPFMTLSFMALPVIPKLKLTDRGLFDVERFSYIPLSMRQ